MPADAPTPLGARIPTDTVMNGPGSRDYTAPVFNP